MACTMSCIYVRAACDQWYCQQVPHDRIHVHVLMRDEKEVHDTNHPCGTKKYATADSTVST